MTKLSGLFFFVVLTAIAQKPTVPLSTQPLSADQVAIYKDFLSAYQSEDKDLKFVLNVAATTVPLLIEDSDLKGCARGIAKRDAAAAGMSVHRLPAELEGAKAHLVDAKTHKINDPGDAIRKGQPVDNAVDAGFRAGLFTFSEIAFDSRHQLAAFSFSFHCGRLCGHGGLVIYELRNSKWSRSKRDCGGWVS